MRRHLRREQNSIIPNCAIVNRHPPTPVVICFLQILGRAGEQHEDIIDAVCFAVPLLTFGVSSAQDTTNHDDMKAEDSKNEVRVTGTISETGKTFVSTIDGKSWTILNPDAVKGHEGHHVILTANFDADKKEVRVVSLKMPK